MTFIGLNVKRLWTITRFQGTAQESGAVAIAPRYSLGWRFNFAQVRTLLLTRICSSCNSSWQTQSAHVRVVDFLTLSTFCVHSHDLIKSPDIDLTHGDD